MSPFTKAYSGDRYSFMAVRYMCFKTGMLTSVCRIGSESHPCFCTFRASSVSLVNNTGCRRGHNFLQFKAVLFLSKAVVPDFDHDVNTVKRRLEASHSCKADAPFHSDRLEAVAVSLPSSRRCSTWLSCLRADRWMCSIFSRFTLTLPYRYTYTPKQRKHRTKMFLCLLSFWTISAIKPWKKHATYWLIMNPWKRN